MSQIAQVMGLGQTLGLPVCNFNVGWEGGKGWEGGIKHSFQEKNKIAFMEINE